MKVLSPSQKTEKQFILHEIISIKEEKEKMTIK